MLRCKSGDLAIVMDSSSEWHGMIVEVLYFIGEWRTNRGMESDLWAVSKNGCTIDREWKVRYCKADNQLLPIRPDELKDVDEKAIESKLYAKA